MSRAAPGNQTPSIAPARHAASLRHVRRLVAKHPDVRLAVDQDLRRVHVQRRQRGLVGAALHGCELLDEPSFERLVLRLTSDRAASIDLPLRLLSTSSQTGYKELAEVTSTINADGLLITGGATQLLACSTGCSVCNATNPNAYAVP